jgi:hypothetical protein
MVHPAAGFGMWPNVQKNFESATVSFQAAKTKLGEVLESASKSGGFFGVNRGAWKLGLRVSSLAVYRERLRAHYMAFRVGASMMRLYVLSLSLMSGARVSPAVCFQVYRDPGPARRPSSFRC